ncbi:DegT/DnrJ/EryC1/StrS family aminotransferase [Lewinella sp. IMCC34183]|uniref:DegT/DnrJ/EryC1/StrS family aminotransferase n=1 Tax=Lewinella sp. IMCC34183 TaxID=2248762 RepID=UPI000E261543|nr:DegT/DnrJ/EryC1/StrS family aminotransferase [Lewinella sp. IMCC34183]
MTIPLIDLQAQYQSLRPAIDDRIAAVLSEAAFIGSDAVAAFGEAFASYAGHAHAVTCGNGTDALELLMDAWEIGPGDEVIVPAMSWISTSEIVATRGARPVFVDVDPLTHCLDPDRAAAAVTDKTRAIIAVHLYGHPAPLGALRTLADQRGLYLIEDCAQAHGARYRGRHIGTIGDAATYSFFPSKSLGAYGDGGLVGTDSAELADRVRALANHGMPGRRHYHRYHGRNSRLDGLQAAVLLEKLPHLDAWISAKNRLAGLYRDHLAKADLRLPMVQEDAYHGYHLFVVRSERRDELADYLGGAGIATTVHYPTPLPLHACYAGYGHRPEEFPEAVALSRTALSLPMYAELTDEQLAYVTDHVNRFFGV